MLIIAGDICPDYNVPTLFTQDIVNFQLNWWRSCFLPWLARQPYKKCIFVAGNHDWLFQSNQKSTSGLADYNAIYLENTYCYYNGVSFFGSPYSVKYGNWAFMERDEILANVYCGMPSEGIDVLISHGPPYFYGDKNTQGEHCGSLSLFNRIDTQCNLKFVICGHLHEARGFYKHKDVDIINCSLLDEHYRRTNEPIMIEI